MKEIDSVKKGYSLVTKIIELKDDILQYLNANDSGAGPIMVLQAYQDLWVSVDRILRRQAAEAVSNDPGSFKKFCDSMNIPQSARESMLRDLEKASKKNPAGAAEAEEVNIEPIN